MIRRLKNCIDTWCSKHGIDKSILAEWKDKIIDNVDAAVILCTTKHFQNFVRVYFSKSTH